MTSENWENTAKAKEAESEPAMLRDRLASEYGILIEQYKSESADQLAQSHEKYQRLNDKRQEERFFWILAAIVVFDAHFFMSMSPAGINGIMLIQIIGIFGLAKMLGVQYVANWVDKILSVLLRKLK